MSQSENSKSMDEEGEIMALLHLINGSSEFERCPSSKAARNLAYRLLFLQKIKEFCETDASTLELNFHTFLNKKKRTYIQSVVTNINKREIKNVYNSFLENDLFKKINKMSNYCYINVIFSGQ